VNPRGSETAYFFSYGTTTSYGKRTPTTTVGSAARSVPASAAVGSLKPQTTYHFRVVAFSPAGTTRGADRTFRTPKVPVTLSIFAAPNPVAFGDDATISGAVGGASAGTQVVLEVNPFPYTAGFTAAGNPQVTGAGGTFAFPIVALPATAQFRVRTNGSTPVYSPIATVGVAVRVSLTTRVRRLRHGAYVRLSGSVTPAHDGTQLGVQKLSRGRWVTVRGTIARHGSAAASSYNVRVRTAHSGTYRVFVRVADGDHVSAASRTANVRLGRRR
jgi:hypothetical protein